METLSDTDEALAKRVQDGDADAFGMLVERYEPKLLRYGTKFLADRDDIADLVQDAFLNAYRNIKSFDLSERFSPWMYRVAHNVFVSGLRKRSRNPVVLVDFDTFVAHPVAPENTMRESEEYEMRALVEKGLTKLPPRYREVLVLFFLEELSYKEIADVLHVPVSTVGVRIKRAKDALRNAYAAMNMHYDA